MSGIRCSHGFAAPCSRAAERTRVPAPRQRYKTHSCEAPGCVRVRPPILGAAIPGERGGDRSPRVFPAPGQGRRRRRRHGEEPVLAGAADELARLDPGAVH